MFHDLKIKKVLRDFYKETGIQLTIKPKPLPKEIQEKGDKLFYLAQENPDRAIPQLEELIEKYPEIPSFKNHLSNAYLSIGKLNKGNALIDRIVVEHPKYVFGIANKILNTKDDKALLNIGHLLGSPRNIRSIIGEKNTIHLAEYLQYQLAAGYYEASIGEADSAENRLDELIKLKANDEMINFLAQYIALDTIKKMAEPVEQHQAKTFSVKPREKIAIRYNEKQPAFQHEKISLFYKKSIEELSVKEIDQIFALPRESLINDLHLVIKDSIQRLDFFGMQGYDESTREFAIHALYFLGAIGDPISLKPILDLLRMGEDFTDYWFSDFGEGLLVPAIFHTGKDKLEVLKKAALEEYNYGFDRAIITTSVTQLAFHYPKRKTEVIEWINSIIQHHLDHPDNEGIIDTNFLNSVVSDLVDLRALDSIPLIEQLFQNGWVDDSMDGDLEEIKKQMLEPFPLHYKKPMPQNIHEYYNGEYEARAIPYPELSNDKAEEMEKIFNSPAKQKVIEQLTLLMEEFKDPSFETDEMYKEDNLSSYTYQDDDYETFYQEPFQRETPKVGRNAPCPCGSGKKYKRCCMNK